jgi:hypothetical protein
VDSEYITLVAQIPLTPYIIPISKHSYSVPVLKSNLQKAVRRGNSDAATSTVYQLLQQGHESQTELFRRLPIILLEDTLLQTSILSRWTWWMMAHSKGWKLSLPEIQQLLGDIVWICGSKHRDHLSKQESPISLLGLDAIQCIQKKTALFSIWIRSHWGGMNGDMAWLRGLFTSWLSRTSEWSFVSSECPPAQPIPNSLELLDIHKLPEAIDFHCCTAMKSDLANRYGISESEIQEAIWWHRSELNVRTWISNSHSEYGVSKRIETKPVFARIEKDLQVYIQRMWKGKKSESFQTSLFQFIKRD